MILLDTNLLGRMTDRKDLHYSAAHRAVKVLRARGEALTIVPQNLFEFWAVATRDKAHNGLSMSPARAGLWIDYFRRIFILLPDRPDLSDVWLALVKESEITGFKAHDVRLVAAMQTYGILSLLTLNRKDFSRLPIKIMDPMAL